MITALLLVILLAAVLLSAVSSGTETGVYCLNRVRLRVAAERGRPGARQLAEAMRRPEDLVITALLGTNISDYIVTATTSALLLRAAVPVNLTELYATATVTPLILVFGGVIPKDWFRRESDRLMYALALPGSLALRAARATGLVWALRSLTHRLARWIDPLHEPDNEAILRRAGVLRLLHEGAAHGGLTVWQRSLMDRVMGISNTPVSRVMITRDRAATVPRAIPRGDFLRIARMAHFSRLPVYESDRQRIIGIVNVYDVLTDAEQRPVAAHVREALRLPPETSVSTALLRMQQTREAMAIVENAAGMCLGILTIKDLAVEIIGDFEAW
ncbi:MAG: CNNM domain-containing protein [Phycisphaerae bacterium]|jgi:CBS domain containing-hemolysin-like protein